VKLKLLILMVLTAGLAACQNEPETDTASRVAEIASEFVSAWYERYPAEGAEAGFPRAPLDHFGDNSREGIARFDARIDAWLEELNHVDPAGLAGTPAARTWMFTAERLQAIVDKRVCRMNLWNISPTWTGWQSRMISALAVQPVETDDDRDVALARARDIPRYIDTEISNLRRGLESGLVAPASNVAAVLTQIESLVETPVEESPFYSPAARAGDGDFAAAYQQVIDSAVTPALLRYRDFLADSYRGRDLIGVAGNPDGAACYEASVRYYSSLRMSAGDIHRAGLTQMSRIHAEMLAIAKELFGTADLQALFNELRTNPEYTFESEEDMLDYVNAAVARAETAMGDWFLNVPPSRLVVYPAPAYEKDSGGGFYSSGADPNELVGYYKVGTWNPTGISKAGTEATAFHESWPGHHLDNIITLSNESLHEIQKYTYIAGMGEGWALYSERLADEIGLYSSEIARLGMLSNEAYRAGRLVVDTGMHVMGWTRQEAIDYMLANTAEGLDSLEYEIDRYAAVPGQATAYLLGSLEIQRLRRHAESRLGDRFDIRAFHDRMLRNGAVTLPMLATTVDEWIEETLAD